MPSSHWPRTLGTCGVPSKTEANDIQNIISLGNSDLSKLDVELDRVQEVVKQLSRRRDEISEHITKHKAFLSPVRGIPDEVLAEIFICCLPQFEREGKRSSSFRRLQAPLLLAQICSRWRAIALSTQKLWSFIHIDYGPLTAESDVAQMSLWLERSGTHLLSLVLRERIDPSNYTHEDRALILDTILSSSRRWQDVEICALRETVDYLSPIRNALPALQSVALRMNNTNFQQPCICDAFEIAPALRTVDLGVDVLPTTFKFPWIHLTDFASHDTMFTPPECLEILRLCPRLISCWFGILYDHPIEPTTPPLQHFHLINFRLPPESHLGSFFDCLTLPALGAVCLDQAQTSVTQGWPGPQFLNLLRRSSCTLHKFTWALDSVKIENILPCLEIMPDLKELQIFPDLGHSLPELLKSLTLGKPDGAERQLCPKLQAIQLSVDHAFDAKVLSDFVKSRRNIDTVRDGVVRFRCIRLLPVPMHWEPEMRLRDLKKFEDNGLDILVQDLGDELRPVVL